MKIFKNKKGVTLAEMMAVIVIMGIIAAIAIPVFDSMITRTQERAVEADAVVIFNAAEMFCAQDGTTSCAPEIVDLANYINKDLTGIYTETDAITITAVSGRITNVTILDNGGLKTASYNGIETSYS